MDSEANIRNKLSLGKFTAVSDPMFRGNWRIILAVLGLITVGGILSTGYYQLESSDQQPYSPEKYQPARDARFPIFVKKPRGSPEPYQPNCQAPQNRDDANLCGQWSAVQASAETNRLSRIGLRVTYSEFAALVFSLIFAGFATSYSAQQVRLSKNAMTQIKRPFVFQDSHIVTTVFDTSTNEPIGWRVAVQWKNGGNTPAHRTATHLNSSRIKGYIPEDFGFDNFGELVINPTFLGPGAITQSGELIFSLDEVRNMRDGIINCFIWGWYEYSDTFEGSPRHRSEFAFKLNVVGDPFPTGIFFATQPLQGHNGFDNYCTHQPCTTGFEKPAGLVGKIDRVAGALEGKVLNVRFEKSSFGWKLIFDNTVQNFGRDPVTLTLAPVGWAFGGLPPEPPIFPTVASNRSIQVPALGFWMNKGIDLNQQPIPDEVVDRVTTNVWPLFIYGRFDITDKCSRHGSIGYCYLVRFLGPQISEISPVLNNAYWRTS